MWLNFMTLLLNSDDREDVHDNINRLCHPINIPIINEHKIRWLDDSKPNPSEARLGLITWQWMWDFHWRLGEGAKNDLVSLTQALKTDPALSKVSEFTSRAWIPPQASVLCLFLCSDVFPHIYHYFYIVEYHCEAKIPLIELCWAA